MPLIRIPSEKRKISLTTNFIYLFLYRMYEHEKSLKQYFLHLNRI